MMFSSETRPKVTIFSCGNIVCTENLVHVHNVYLFIYNFCENRGQGPMSAMFNVELVVNFHQMPSRDASELRISLLGPSVLGANAKVETGFFDLLITNSCR